MASPTEIRSALLHGLRATTAEKVYVFAEHILTLVPLETCNRAGIFTWTGDNNTVEVQEANNVFVKPNSILANSPNKISNGVCEVDRQKLLDLLEPKGVSK